MQLMDWLRLHDVRLDVRLEANLDPAEPELQWECEIHGFHCPSGLRPAVSLLGAHGHAADVTAFAATPGDAYHDAVRQLRGLSVNVIFRDRNETLTFPVDLTA
jgi:hypothetical protein